MKKSQFYWAFNDQELTPDPFMSRKRASAMIRLFRQEKRICRIAPNTYKTWTTNRSVYATMKTR